MFYCMVCEWVHCSVPEVITDPDADFNDVTGELHDRALDRPEWEAKLDAFEMED